MVFTGDIDQIDSPYLDKKSNGLSHLFDKMQGQDIFAHVHLERENAVNWLIWRAIFYRK